MLNPLIAGVDNNIIIINKLWFLQYDDSKSINYSEVRVLPWLVNCKYLIVWRGFLCSPAVKWLYVLTVIVAFSLKISFLLLRNVLSEIHYRTDNWTCIDIILIASVIKSFGYGTGLMCRSQHSCTVRVHYLLTVLLSYIVMALVMADHC